MTMTSTRMKYGRERPATVTRRPLRANRLVGRKITVPGISENERNEGNPSPRGEKHTLRPNPNPNFTDEYRY